MQSRSWRVPAVALAVAALAAWSGSVSTATTVSPPTGGAPVLSPATVPSAVTTLLTANPDCPKEMPLPPGPDAKQAAIAALEATIPTIYKGIDTRGYRITGAWPADSRSDPLSEIPGTLCGQFVRERTYVVTLFFPAMQPSADLSQGQDFVSKFPGGWRVWFTYH